MPKCGSQIPICDLPIRFDTYNGCSFLCEYCFVTRKKDNNIISKDEGPQALLNFIGGKRCSQTNWCDWNIPIHWGGMSDPFQPIEKKYKNSLDCLKIFAETQYPFIVSTKSTLISEEPYLSLLEKCNCVVQFSIVSPKFDKIEPGAPNFEDRLEAIRKVAKRVKRVNVRVQPYVREVKADVIEAIKRYAECGVYGLTIEGIKYFKKKKVLIRLGSDYCYPKELLEYDFKQIKEECHKYGLKFYSGENRLRTLGDDLCCCGIDGMGGFKGNTANINHMLFDIDNFKYTKKMKEPGTAITFKSLVQKAGSTAYLKKASYRDLMDICTKTKTYIEALGVEFKNKK